MHLPLSDLPCLKSIVLGILYVPGPTSTDFLIYLSFMFSTRPLSNTRPYLWDIFLNEAPGFKLAGAGPGDNARSTGDFPMVLLKT